MRLKEALRMVVGAGIVYVVMAACGSSEPGRIAGSGGAEGAGGSLGANGGDAQAHDAGFMGSILDALSVPEAKAALPPDVSTEQCSTAVPVGNSGISNFYAEHSYPGKTIADLTSIRAVVHYDTGYRAAAAFPPGYENGIAIPIVKDGAVAVNCGSSSSTTIDSVTFTLPAPL